MAFRKAIAKRSALLRSVQPVQNDSVQEVHGSRGRIPAGWINDIGVSVLTFPLSTEKIEMDGKAFVDYLKPNASTERCSVAGTGLDRRGERVFIHHALLMVDGTNGYGNTAT